MSLARSRPTTKPRTQRVFFFLWWRGQRENVHASQLQLRSELSPVAAAETQHLKVDYFTDVRHNNNPGLGRTRACARFPTPPVSQLLNTFKSTSCVLFVATGARNASGRWSFLSFFLSFFGFLTATERLHLAWSCRRCGRRARGCRREPPASRAWCRRLLLLLALPNSCALASPAPARARG